MKRRTFMTLVSGGLLGVSLAAEAQPPTKIPRIGLLRSGSPPDPFVEAFKQGLSEFGYVEGQNISIEYRWAEGKDDRLPALVDDLVRLKVDIIVASGTAPALAVRHATDTIPLVMPVVNDPVGLGLVASLGRPGGNATGFSALGEELPGKWIELLRETLPGLSRVAALWDPASSSGQVKSLEVAARSIDVRIQLLTVGHPKAFEAAFSEAKRQQARALVVLSSPFFYANRTRIVELAAKSKLPTIYHQKEFVVTSGGLMSYATDFPSGCWLRGQDPQGR